MQGWTSLFGAILFEVIATSLPKATDGFTRPLPTLLVVAGYAGAFYCLSLTLRTMPVGIAYALWSGIGVTLIALIGRLALGQTLDRAALAGMALIVAGVVVINVFSGSGHG